MTVLWLAGYVIMAVCAGVLIVLGFLPDAETTDDWRCAIDCAIILALGCFAEGILFGLSGVGAI